MPQMTGKELIRRLRDIRPDIPAILMLGLGSKPFSRSDLADAIRSVLRKRERQAQ